ncbi:MAG TPA: polyphenol oxidase family protein [Gemmatimonadales bacterium]|nr:polyphenol oxidase family protein [Gemmatimonadales bacterium]
MTVRPLPETPAEPAGQVIERLELEPWSRRFGIVAGITTSSSDFTLNGACPEGTAATHWAALRMAFHRQFPAVVVGYQSHGTEVMIHRHAQDGWMAWPQVDGHVTARRGILLAVTVADCVPVYLADPARGVVGLLHAGWRGIAAGMIERGVAAVASVAKSSPRDIITHCGVAICGACYEVGPEVVYQVRGESCAGASRLDLRAEIQARLDRLGVENERTSSPWCTAHGGQRFHSHRGSKGAAGRMLAYVGMPLAALGDPVPPLA